MASSACEFIFHAGVRLNMVWVVTHLPREDSKTIAEERLSCIMMDGGVKATYLEVMDTWAVAVGDCSLGALGFLDLHLLPKWHSSAEMASRPGILTDWPWKALGSFKYLVVAPWIVESIYSYGTKSEEERDLGNLLIAALMAWRMVHSQIWISLSRHRTAKGSRRIVDKPIEFDQVDRERTWDDQIIFNALLMYLGNKFLPGSSRAPLWRTDGAVLMALLHAGPVEFLYYWFHRALHHHFLYSRYHSHHHSSIVTEPITSVVHPFAEHIAYSLLFAIPVVTSSLCGNLSIVSMLGYLTYIDFMNNMGHCNFELFPRPLFSLFPPLKFLFYTPSFHSLHHTQFRTNYSLFMPMYDYIYGTDDKSSDSLYETSLQREEETPDVIHLTHLTTLDSIYHIRLGFPSLSSHPFISSRWFLSFMWPLTLFSALLSYLSSSTFVLERNRFRSLTLHSRLLPKFAFQYTSPRQYESINKMIEASIVEADKKGVRVVSLGLMNQGEELNGYGEMYVKRHPKLKVRLVDGSSLAAAVVVNGIPRETSEVVFRGKLTKVAYATVFALIQRGVKVMVLRAEEHRRLVEFVGVSCSENIVLMRTNSPRIWLVGGDGLSREEETMAKEGTLFIPFSQFPPKKTRKDCHYHPTPSMYIPESAQNVDSCENWLPRRVMSAWRVGGIVHALEGWEEHECGHAFFFDIDRVWEAALRHGFRPLPPF
ncbi:PREDICTED: protein CER1-like 2 [Tarenaya hassleriana]|uniref:protein CER1-like 2 n=1 Tax=Tarenaya hassleriana TaxID=28532 RepID=UPI00053C7E3E|nr:PREDICTED: protein CER1-like 2 [Tarenaya hassleriana]